MANKSEENPIGLLNGEVLKPFLQHYRWLPQLSIHPSYEKISDNWYKRNLVDYYAIPYLVEDSLVTGLEYPEFFSVGGNTSETNTFTGMDVESLTSVVLNASNLLQGNNVVCIGLEAPIQEAPDILSRLYSDISSAMDLLGTDYQHGNE
jgi:hypothetical protein